MAKTTKIAVVGAGSAQFSAHIITDMCLYKGLYGSQVVFEDIDEDRLDFVTRAAKKLNEELKCNLTITSTTNLDEALEGCDFVISAVQVGGYDWYEECRDISEKYGFYRGNQLYEFSQMQFMLQLIRGMEKNCPDAWHVMAMNPVFEGTTYIIRNSKIKTVGLCHGFHYGVKEISGFLGIDFDKVTYSCPGFNHWLWLTEFQYEGKDAMPMLNDWIKKNGETYQKVAYGRTYHDHQMSRAAIHQYELFGYYPIGDTCRHGGWWYHTDFPTSQYFYGALGGFDSEIGWKQHIYHCTLELEKIRKAADSDQPASSLLDTSFSGEQIVPIINAIANNEKGVFQVNIANNGLMPEFPDDLAVESKAEVDASGMRWLPLDPMPRELIVNAMMPRWQFAERKLEFMRTRSKESLLLFFLHFHWCKDLKTAEALLDEWTNHPFVQKLGLMNPEI